MENPELLLLLERPDTEKSELQPGRRKNLKAQELCFFATNLSELLEAGIPMLRALEGLQKSSAGKSRLGSFIEKSKNEIMQGSQLSKALEGTGMAPAFFSQVVYAGEISGKTAPVLAELAHYLEKEAALRRKIGQALVYPAFILLTGFATLIVLLQFVIPRLAGIYSDFGSELPRITKFILSLNHLALPLTVIFLVGLFGLFIFNLKMPEILHEVIQRLPVTGTLAKEKVLIQFSRLFSILIESGVPILEALQTISGTFDNPSLKKQILLVREELAHGSRLSKSLDKTSWMPLFSKMVVECAEESGRLGPSFAQIAGDSQTRLESRMEFMVRLLEPALILGIGLIVGFVVIGAILPVFDISGIIK